MEATTPFELSLDNDLLVETRRFGSEWLFKWHNLNIAGHTVDVDRFDGGRIFLGGIKFGDQQQQIFWQAIGRYLNNKIHEIFKTWDVATSSYPLPVRRASLEGVEHRLRRFVTSILAASTDTDRRLRGQGYPEKVQPFASSNYSAGLNFEILKLANAHRALIDLVLSNEKTAPWWKRIEIYVSDRRGIFTLIGILVAIILGVLRFFLG